jgi:hypothetical protein
MENSGGSLDNHTCMSGPIRHYGADGSMKLSFEQALIEVWRQTLVENAKTVELGTERFPIRRTPKRGLRQVDFVFEGNEIRGLEQNPQTKSRWAQLARSGNAPSSARRCLPLFWCVVFRGRLASYALPCQARQEESGALHMLIEFGSKFAL